ncbi:hypothetical protein ACF3M2_14045 [Tissierella carlieri]|uniref:hypothetical protein n=1 Tax=Tissierella carlieri TaxID=689904 RepID=UPI003870C24A
MVRRIKEVLFNEKGGANIILIFLFFIICGAYFIYNIFSVGLTRHTRNKIQNTVDLATSRTAHEILIEGNDEEETIKILQELGEGRIIAEGTKTNPYVKIDRTLAMDILKRQISNNLTDNAKILFCSPVLYDMDTKKITIFLENPDLEISEDNAYTFNSTDRSHISNAKNKIESFLKSIDVDSPIKYNLNIDFATINKSTYLVVIKIDSILLNRPMIVASFGGSQVYRKY